MVVIRKQSPRKKHAKKKVESKSKCYIAASPVSPRPIKTVKRRKSTKQNPVSVIDRIAPIGFSEEDGIRIGIYGRGATGKTTLAGTFPRPALWIICSGGEKPGELRSLDTPANRKNIKQVVLEKSSEIEELVDFQKQTGRFATIVLDHVTSLQDHILMEVLNLDKLPEQLSWGIATQQHWGQVGVRLKECLRKFCDLGCNVVTIAHEREFNATSEMQDLIDPCVSYALTAGNARWLEGVVDYTVRTQIQPKMKTVKLRIGGKVVEKQEATRGVNYTIRTGPSHLETLSECK